MDPISLALSLLLKNPDIAANGLRQATTPGNVNTERMVSSFADLSKEVLRCYHKSARYIDADILEKPWVRQDQYNADNSAAIRVRFSGVSGTSYEMTFAVMIKQGMVRTAVIRDTALIPYNKRCSLENWTGTPAPQSSIKDAAETQFQNNGVSAPYAVREIARNYRCTYRDSPERIIRSLIEKDVVLSNPYKIEDAIRYYAVKPGITAFGLPLVAVYGWEANSSFFGRERGTAPNEQMSLVVRGSAQKLAYATSKLDLPMYNSSATIPYSYVDVTNLDKTEAEGLPSGNDPKAAYAQISCNPRR